MTEKKYEWRKLNYIDIIQRRQPWPQPWLTSFKATNNFFSHHGTVLPVTSMERLWPRREQNLLRTLHHKIVIDYTSKNVKDIMCKSVIIQNVFSKVFKRMFTLLKIKLIHCRMNFSSSLIMWHNDLRILLKFMYIHTCNLTSNCSEWIGQICLMWHISITFTSMQNPNLKKEVNCQSIYILWSVNSNINQANCMNLYNLGNWALLGYCIMATTSWFYIIINIFYVMRPRGMDGVKRALNESGMSMEQGRMIVHNRGEWRAVMNAWVMARVWVRSLCMHWCVRRGI